MCASYPFGFDCGILDLIVLIPDHCVSIYFSKHFGTKASSTLRFIETVHAQYFCDFLAYKGRLYSRTYCIDLMRNQSVQCKAQDTHFTMKLRTTRDSLIATQRST